MKVVKQLLVCILLASASAVLLFWCFLLNEATAVVKAVPTQISAARSDLKEQLQELRIDAFLEIDSQASTLQGNLMKQASGVRQDAKEELSQASSAALQAIQEGMQPLNTAAGAATKIAGTLEASRQDLKPVLNNAAAAEAHLSTLTDHADSLVLEAKDFYDGNSDDVQGLLDSATVAVTGVARAADSVAQAAPSMTKSGDSIAASIAKEAEQLTKPQTIVQQIKSWFLLAARAVSFFLM